MKFLDRSDTPSDKSEARIAELTTDLENAKQKLAQCELLIAEALDQTETARAQYETANARAETLRRHLTAKEEQLITLQATLHQRDERIAELERSGAVIKNAAATNDNAKHFMLDPDRVADMGLALEALEQPGTLYRITRPTTTIGRNASNDISINSNSISRFHARLIVESDGIYLVDLESTNGCKVNGKRITRELIGEADAITIGNEKFRFSMGVAPEVEARGMQETHVLLNDSAIFVPAPNSNPKPKSAQ